MCLPLCMVSLFAFEKKTGIKSCFICTLMFHYFFYLCIHSLMMIPFFLIFNHSAEEERPGNFHDVLTVVWLSVTCASSSGCCGLICGL